MRIGIAAGHSLKSEGERLYEFQRCQAAVNHLLAIGAQSTLTFTPVPSAIHHMANNEALRAKVQFFNAQAVDLALELHLNAAGGNYSTTIYYNDDATQARTAGSLVENALDAGLPWPSIGPQPEAYFQRGFSFYFLRATRMPALLLEPGFKDTPSHRVVLDRDDFPLLYATALFTGLMRYDCTSRP